MGTLTLSMKHILLAALAGLLHAEVVVKHLHIHEGEVDYTQTVTFDYNRNIQILEVPAHNSIVHSKTIFDFNQGVLFESHPERNICYMKDIPEGVVSMDSFAAFLDKNNDTIIASQQKTTKRAYKTTKKIAPHQLSSMASEVVAECAGSTVFQVQPARPEEFALSYSRAPKSLADAFLAGKEECQMEDNCLWQTCQVGSSDSCWWTVNCGANEDNCDETLEHNQILHDCAGESNQDCQVYCTPCFNLQCPGCQSYWDNGCKPGMQGQTIDACPADPALGKDCGKLYCRKHDEISGGKWNCPGDEPDAGRIEEDHTCLLMCDSGEFGGMITCKSKDRNTYWDESGLVGC